VTMMLRASSALVRITVRLGRLVPGGDHAFTPCQFPAHRDVALSGDGLFAQRRQGVADRLRNVGHAMFVSRNPPAARATS